MCPGIPLAKLPLNRGRMPAVPGNENIPLPSPVGVPAIRGRHVSDIQSLMNASPALSSP
jgi:hypothetical protein